MAFEAFKSGDPTVKARAMRRLQEGVAERVVCQMFNISSATLLKWKHEFNMVDRELSEKTKKVWAWRKAHEST